MMKGAASVVVLMMAMLACAQATTVVDLISGNGDLTTLASLLSAAKLDTQLDGAGPFTVFAPTNEAFAALPTYQVAYLKDPANAGVLTALLKYHVATGKYDSPNLYQNEKIPTLQGADVFAEYLTNTTTMGLVSATCNKNVEFQGPDAAADNGLVQVIDQVLMPPAVFQPDQLFWVEQRGNSRVGYSGYNCRSKGTTVITANQEKPVGIAVDSAQQVAFWSNDMNAKPYDSWLSKGQFDGSDVSVFVQKMYDPQGMDTDSKTQKLYYTEHQGSRVQRCNYDGSDVETVLSTDPTAWFPADVAVDADEELMFVTIQSVPQVLQGKVIAYFTNGTMYREIAQGLAQNFGLCLDRYHKHVYFIQGGHGGSISCSAYGSHPCPNGKDGVFITDLQYPYMCDVDTLYAPYGGPTTVIFSQANYPGAIYGVDSTGKNLVKMVDNLQAPMGVKLGSTFSV